MVYRIKLFNQMSIAVLIEEHHKPTQFGKPSKLIGLDTGTKLPSILIGQDICHLFSERGGDFDLKIEDVPRYNIFHTDAKFQVFSSYQFLNQFGQTNKQTKKSLSFNI